MTRQWRRFDASKLLWTHCSRLAVALPKPCCLRHSAREFTRDGWCAQPAVRSALRLSRQAVSTGASCGIRGCGVRRLNWLPADGSRQGEGGMRETGPTAPPHLRLSSCGASSPSCAPPAVPRSPLSTGTRCCVDPCLRLRGEGRGDIGLRLAQASTDISLRPWHASATAGRDKQQEREHAGG